MLNFQGAKMFLVGEDVQCFIKELQIPPKRQRSKQRDMNIWPATLLQD